MISYERVLPLLESINPWWTTNQPDPLLLKEYKRFAYFDAMKWLTEVDLRRVIILTGLRRVGKTTIMFQMIEELSRKGISSENIVYVSFDHPMLKYIGIDEILGCYHENVNPGKDVYYF